MPSGASKVEAKEMLQGLQDITEIVAFCNRAVSLARFVHCFLIIIYNEQKQASNSWRLHATDRWTPQAPRGSLASTLWISYAGAFHVVFVPFLSIMFTAFLLLRTNECSNIMMFISKEILFDFLGSWHGNTFCFVPHAHWTVLFLQKRKMWKRL